MIKHEPNREASGKEYGELLATAPNIELGYITTKGSFVINDRADWEHPVTIQTNGTKDEVTITFKIPQGPNTDDTQTVILKPAEESDNYVRSDTVSNDPATNPMLKRALTAINFAETLIRIPKQARSGAAAMFEHQVNLEGQECNAAVIGEIRRIQIALEDALELS